MTNSSHHNLKLLVTGGLGFIGSNFIRHVLQTTSWFMLNLDKQTYAGNPENLKDIEKNPRYQWVKGDIADSKVVQSLMEKADIVVNFAAETHVDRSILNPQAFLDTNVLGTFTLLEAARKSHLSLFLHVSTDEVYGSIEEGEFCEQDPLAPNSPYAASKASSDLLVRAYQKTYKLPTVITRCSNNFGPYQFPEKALPLLITNAMENLPFPVYGNGNQVRDWTYVLDHVRAILLLIEKASPGEIYNIGGTCSISNQEIFKKILARMKKPAELLQTVPDRPGHDFRYALNCDKIRTLGWSPKISFEKALEDTIDWYKKFQNWWKPLKEKTNFKSYYQDQYSNSLPVVKQVNS